MALTRVAGLLPAAGSGSRLGRGPKAFLELEGKTLLAHAAETLATVCAEVVVAVPAGRLDDAHALLPGAYIVAGGSSRQETVRLLLDATPDATHVIVHDAARPFTPVRVVQAVLEAAHEHGAASAALPIADTLHDTRTNAPLERDALRAIQTPQAFRRALLAEAHRVPPR
jgi:4-diphosphocytidyl-2-methyl-D-erithritol synthase